MLLYPTLNSSLLVSSNNGLPMSEENRIKLNTITKIYQYEVKNNFIIKESEKVIYGMKELARIGVKSSDGHIYPIEYNSVKGHLVSGQVFKGKSASAHNGSAFLFTKTKIVESKIINNKNLNKNKSSGVWIYNYKTREFISFEKNVKSCLSKYEISSTHFKRIRKFGLEFKGKLFSNNKL